jgi:ATP-binding cassette, subfamily B, multidrug efflux pump
LHSITSMGILYLMLVVPSSLFSIVQVNTINRVGQTIIKQLRGRVFRTIQFLSLSYLDKKSSGSLITIATNDIEALSEMYTDVIISLFEDIFLIIGIIYMMVSLNVKLAMVSFVVVPIIFLIVFILKKKIKRNFYNMKKLIGKLNGFLAENISGMKIVQIFGAQKEKKKEFTKINDDYYKTTVFQVWLNSFLRPASDVLQSLSVAILIWYGMGKISNSTLQIGVLYAFTTYIKQFFNPIADLADEYTTIQSALVSGDRIFDLLDQASELENLDDGKLMNKLDGDIEFRDVWFSYNDRDWILKGISFKLEKGKTAAFVGETGAGKTTIMSLISRFYNIQKGEILIDGININDIRLRDLRSNIAVVLQDAFLFSGNIEKNIVLNKDIDQDQINYALEVSRATDFVKNFPNGLEEPVMERGMTLSAGQRQLLSFARAIAFKPSILVLDEATANIDTHTEKLIQKAIESVVKDRTTLIIAHRLSTVRNANVIIVLSHGEIVEIGNHDELMQKDGYYNNMIKQAN